MREQFQDLGSAIPSPHRWRKSAQLHAEAVIHPIIVPHGVIGIHILYFFKF